MKRRYMILAIVLAVVLFFLLFGYAPLPTTPDLPIEPGNTYVYSFFASRGIEDALVDGNAERVLIRYNSATSVDLVELAKEAAATFPESKRIVVQRFSDFKPVEQVTIEMADALALLADELTEDQFAARARTEPLA